MQRWDASYSECLNSSKLRKCRKKTHQFGQPTSGTSVHSTFICGLALLYALFRDPTVLPLRQVFVAVKAASATLFAYSQSDSSSAALHDVFEELSSACMDKIGGYRPQEAPAGIPAVTQDWQTASAQATSSLGEFCGFHQRPNESESSSSRNRR
jgi:hypothetical protein